MKLAALLDHAATLDAEYEHHLSSHLTMALCALKRLGAGDESLAAFATTYASRLGAAPPTVPWPAGEPWRGRLGDPAAWPAYRDLFWHWLVTEDAASVLAQVLPTLVQGCGGAAFHGLIRVGYAVQSGHGRELADALAYWACRWLPLGPGTPALPSGRVADPLAVLKALRMPRPAGGLIAVRMHAAALNPGFAQAVAPLRLDAGTLPRLARTAARVYAASGNFTALHLVTSAHALRVLWPLMAPPDGEPAHAVQVAALAHYWQAYAAGWVASGAVLGRATPPLPWADLVAAALRSDDDHLIKLVDACREEQQALGGAPDWQRAASRAVVQARHTAAAPPR